MSVKVQQIIVFRKAKVRQTRRIVRRHIVYIGIVNKRFVQGVDQGIMHLVGAGEYEN